MTPGRSVARKLDADKVRQMRQLRREGSTLKQIASRFDVSVPLASMTMDERQGQLRGINGASEATA